jgi:hypothetical protein
VRIVISQYGGRVFGPFLSPASESIFWTNRAFATPAAFEAWMTAGQSNLGGERLWIAPEIQYNVRDRTRFDETYAVPTQIDPGCYALDQPRASEWRLAQVMKLDVYHVASGTKDLRVEILIRRVDDPLRHVSAYPRLIDGVIFAGYEQTITLGERRHDAIMSAAWNLIQLNPGGVILIPAFPGVEWTDYYDPARELQTFLPGHVQAQITGQRRYKLGYRAAYLTGRVGYFNTLGDGRAYLIVRQFFNNPSNPYVNEPGRVPGAWGDSVQVYNDGGALGGFGELEVHGQTIGGTTGRSASRDQLVLWLYAGPLDRIKDLMPYLLGIEF